MKRASVILVLVMFALGLVASGISCSKTVSMAPTPTLTITPTPAPTIKSTPMPILIITITIKPMPALIPKPSPPNLTVTIGQNPGINIDPVELVRSLGTDGAITYLNDSGVPNATAIVQSAISVLQARQTVESVFGRSYSTFGPFTASEVDKIVATIGGTKAQDTLTTLGYPNAAQVVSDCQSRIAAISALEPFNIIDTSSDFDVNKELSYATASAIITALGTDDAVKYLSALNYPNVAPYIQAVNALMPFDFSNGLSYSTAKAIVSALGMDNAIKYLSTIVGSENIGSQSISSYLSQAANSVSNKP
jgi:hypothetical protein